MDSIPELLDIMDEKLIQLESKNTDSLTTFLRGRYYEMQGHYNYQIGNPVVSLENLSKAASFYKNSNTRHFEAYNLNMMGTINYLIGRYDASMASYMDAQRLLTTEHNDSSMLLEVCIDIANLYQKTDDFQKAIDLNLALLNWPKKYITDEVSANLHNNLGINYILLKDNTNAKKHLLFAYNLFENYEEEVSTLDKVINNLATLYVTEENYEDAERFYFQSLQLKEEMQNNRDKGIVYRNLADLYIKQNRLDEAEKYGLLALQSSNEYNLLDRIQNANLTMSRVYEAKGDFENALKFLKESNHIKDSIQMSSLQTKINFIEQQYDRETELIKLQNLQNEKAIVDLQYDRSRLINIILIILISGTSVFLFFWLKSQRAKREVDKILNQKNIELATINSLVRGQEEERNRIARELHDSLGNTIALLNSKIQKEQPYNKELIDLISDASRELHSISHDLMPGILLRFGLKDALEDLITKWTQNADVSIDLNVGDLGFANDDPTALTIYRIIQELIKNAVEKGKASYILIEIFETSERLTINCEDNGSGFNKTSENTGLGLKNIETRVSYLKGTFMINSTDQGSRFRIIIPYENTKHI